MILFVRIIELKTSTERQTESAQRHTRTDPENNHKRYRRWKCAVVVVAFIVSIAYAIARYDEYKYHFYHGEGVNEIYSTVILVVSSLFCSSYSACFGLVFSAYCLLKRFICELSQGDITSGLDKKAACKHIIISLLCLASSFNEAFFELLSLIHAT